MTITRIAAYVDKEDYREIRSVLALSGISFSEWLREVMRGTLEVRKKKAKGSKA